MLRLLAKKLHIPHRWHAHIAGALKAVANGLANAASQVADAVKKYGCAAVKATAKGGLTVYQGAVTLAEGTVKAASKSLDVAKAFLQGVLLLNSAAFYLMEKLAGAVFIVDYAKLEAFIKPNLLDSGISGEVRFNFGGTTVKLGPITITLGNIVSVVTSIFNRIWNMCKSWGKSLFEEEETQTALMQVDFPKLSSVAKTFTPKPLEGQTFGGAAQEEFDANFQLFDPELKAKADLLSKQLDEANAEYEAIHAQYLLQLEKIADYEKNFLKEVEKRAKRKEAMKKD